MEIKRLVFALLCLVPLLSQGQFYRQDEDEEPGRFAQKLGVKIGLTNSWLVSDGLQNGRSQIGLQGAAYYRIKLREKFQLHAELGAAYRGSRFSNSPTQYSRLGLFYLELPLYAMIPLDKKEQHFIMAGPIVSHLVRPAFFVGNELYPTFTDLPLRKFDYLLGAAYHFSTEFVGIQIAYKYGLNNISKGDWTRHPTPGSGGSNGKLYLFEVTPSLGNISRITNQSIEISLYF